MEDAFTSGLASNGVMVVIGGIAYFIYKKCNSKCHYDSKTGWNVDIGGNNEDESGDEEDKNIDKILELLTKTKSIREMKKKDSLFLPIPKLQRQIAVVPPIKFSEVIEDFRKGGQKAYSAAYMVYPTKKDIGGSRRYKKMK